MPKEATAQAWKAYKEARAQAKKAYEEANKIIQKEETNGTSQG